MQSAPQLDNDDARVRRLHGLGVLDTESETVLDAFTDLAASFTGMPIALISLIDRDRQWYKSAVGLPQGDQTPRAVSFCGHAIASDGLFEVEDATLDERFHDNPLVLEAPHVKHYAGAPLVMPGGERIGTICVVDHKAGRLDKRGRLFLCKLAQNVVNVLLLRESELHLRGMMRAELALRESEAKFHAITDAMPQMVWSAWPDGSLDYCNQRWRDFTGTPADDPLPRDWTSVAHPDDRSAAHAAWRLSLATGQPCEVECRMRHVSGAFRWTLVRALPVRDDVGAILQWLGTNTDIEDQKRTQDELHDANRRKDEFLAMLAHELRNPLAPISTAAQILRIAPGDPARVQKSSELISRQVGHMTTLVDDLLDVSRVTRGLVRIEHAVVDLKQVVHSAMEQARPLVEARRHEVALRLTAAPACVDGDRVRLIQVVSNLLNNAAKYTPEGGLISVALQVEDGQACITVSDNGSGIEPALLPHVFDLFTQGKRTPDRAQGGLGLGLALVRSLVALHGGSVQAHSAGRGQGSSFELRLPLTEAVCAAHNDPALAPEEPPRSLKVMVVDDNVDAANLLGMWLETQGHRVTVKTDSAQALDAAAREPAQVYVLDIGLPDIDGYELARRLRRQPANEHAKLIALTGYGQPSDIALSMAAGFDRHFVKPMDPDSLSAALQEITAESPHSTA
ncbi:MAG TPA: ATP-binding protein [Ramlibacter sp.]|nr:ATP-binding protein [Ramlibacter sp.]